MVFLKQAQEQNGRSLDGRSLHLLLMGMPQILLDGAPLSLASHKATALLYYLAVERPTASRPFLAGLLWGNMPEVKARANLRVALAKLRQHLSPYFSANRQTITFVHQASYSSDLGQFEYCLRQGTAAYLETAVALYRGAFLSDFHIRAATAFETWLRQTREELRLRLLGSLTTLIEHHETRQRYDKALSFVHKLLSLEPWHEEGHRQAMSLLATSGQRTAALVHYQTYRQQLLNDLGVEPETASRQLYDCILNGDFWQADC